ncbi:hypothetical protein QA612_04620 [Evansella sp. AB-P1]|uniref:hypothetical protein n=1 Tax=Evansella sp. AB-P1 TaxID=3037653 RepID=UPI00241CA413|nr:hypothetical protein [Evansella sp. AB-P1]MDG5786765.1 hypothetical protein [Evansella sp. AB-P1]
MEDLEPLVELEDVIVYEYNSVIGINATDDWTTYVHIEEVVVPMYLDFIDRLEAVSPDTREVRGAHEIYIQASNLQYNAMLKTLSALEFQSYEMMSEANQMLSEARATMRRYVHEMEDLAEKHNIEFEE